MGWGVVYDPAWDMPQLNWVQQGSFEGGAVPPITEPDAGTQIMLGPIAQEWMPVICGALDQLRNPSAWVVADDDAMYNTLRRVDTLLGLICGNREGCVPTLSRLQDCVLQTSTDGGSTWTDVPGWGDNFAGCVQDALPPPPPIIGPTPIEQRACNIAGFLATEIIEKGLSNAINNWTTDRKLLDFASDISDKVLAEALPLTNLFVQAATDVFNLISAGNIAALQTAMADPDLWSAVTCAIYNAIRTAGEVTDGNYAALVANVCAITYSNADAVSAVCDFVTDIGAPNLRHWQIEGAMDIVDCTDCGTWCYQWDFTVSAGPWIVNAAYGEGAWSAGTGWHSTPGTDIHCITIKYVLPTPMLLSSVCITDQTVNDATGAERTIYMRLSGANQRFQNLDTGEHGPLVECLPGGTPVLVDEVWINLCSEEPGGTDPDFITSVELEGPGPNPFGVGNCTY